MIEAPKDYVEDEHDCESDPVCLLSFFVAVVWGIGLGWVLRWMWVALAG